MANTSKPWLFAMAQQVEESRPPLKRTTAFLSIIFLVPGSHYPRWEIFVCPINRFFLRGNAPLELGVVGLSQDFLKIRAGRMSHGNKLLAGEQRSGPHFVHRDLTLFL